jgi:hypothetical protein
MEETAKPQTNRFKWLPSLFFGLVILQLVLNFLGLPLVKLNFLVMTLVCVVICLVSPINEAIPSLMYYSLFEGQGRIVWGYHPLFRIVFDLTSALLVLRNLIKNRKLYDEKRLPKMIYIGIICHFMWWFFELFNPEGAGALPALATAKYYIFPFLLFLTFIQNPLDINDQKTINFFTKLMIVFVSIGALSLYQNEMGETFMDGISTNYSNLFEKFKEFKGARFRPWATSHSPGGFSSFIYPTIGYLFFVSSRYIKNKKLTYFIYPLKIVSLGIIIFASFITQVRSALIKALGTLFIGFWLNVWGSKDRIRMLATLGITLGLALPVAISKYNELEKSFNLAETMKRWQELQDQGVGTQRSGVEEIVEVFINRGSFMGFGPGMTTGYLPHYQRQREKMVDIPAYWFWSMDNLLAFLFLELGVGCIFYVFTVAAVHFYLIKFIIELKSRGREKEFLICAPALASITMMNIGNWGVVGLPFNPESFYYWMWASIGFNVYTHAMDDIKAQQAAQEATEQEELNNEIDAEGISGQRGET